MRVLLKRFFRKSKLKMFWKYTLVFCFGLAVFDFSSSRGYVHLYISSGVVNRLSFQNSTVRLDSTSSAPDVIDVKNMSNVLTKRNNYNITLKPRTAKFLNAGNNSYGVAAGTYYLTENRGLCSEKENLSVVVIVHTAPTNFINRMAIRKTWGNNSYYSDLGTTKLLFLLGRVNNASLQRKIEEEFKQFGDLVQGDFMDSYYNMTLKGTMGFKWLSERCRNAKVVLKVDDDVIVNMFAFLEKFVPSFLLKPRHMACRRLRKAKIERRKSSKWSIEERLFSGESVYPDFCQGFIVAISNDVVPELFASASLTPFFWIDDIFLYGLVPENVPEMFYTDMQYNKRVIWGADKAISCYKRSSCSYLAILLWGDFSRKMEEIWSLMSQNYKRNLQQ